MLLMLLLERLITGVHAEKVRTNPSVMVVIRVVNSHQSHSKSKKVKQCTFVDVNIPRVARYVMVHITRFDLRMGWS